MNGQETAWARLRVRDEGCLSDLALDRLLLEDGEVGSEHAVARAHLDGCGACRARYEALQAEYAEFGETRWIAGDVARIRRRARRPARGLFVAVGGIAAAAVVTGLVLLPPRNAVLPAQTRTKGLPVQMSIFVKPGGPRASVRPHGAKPGERVAPGDALRFAVGAARAGHLSVWEEEGSGRLVQHFPIGGAPATRPWPAGPPRLLPGSLVLDESAGPSRFAAVLCEEPLEPEPLRNAVAQILSRIDAPVGSAPAETDSCVGMVFELKKASGGG